MASEENDLYDDSVRTSSSEANEYSTPNMPIGGDIYGDGADGSVGSYSLYERPGNVSENRLPTNGAARSPGFDWSSIVNRAFAPSGNRGGGMMGDMMTPTGLLSLLSSGMGIGTSLYNSSQANSAANKYMNQAKKPFNIDQYNQPMSQLEEAALRRELTSQLTQRGVPLDSAVASGWIAEMMAKTKNERFMQAAQLAERQQANMLNAYGLNAQIAGSKQPAGDTSAVANYLQQMMAQRARLAEEQRTRQWMTELLQLYKQMGSSRLPNQSPGASVYTPPQVSNAGEGQWEGDRDDNVSEFGYGRPY